MFSWLCSIFAEKAQQAQLIAIVVSAIIALSVVLLNQHLLSRRARKEIYIKKIEEFYSLILEFEDASNIHASKRGAGIEHYETNNKVIDIIDKMETITELYFSEINFKTSFYKKELESLSTLPIDESFSRIRENAQSLKEQSKVLMRKYKH